MLIVLESILWVIRFFFGACIFSFLNVVIDRFGRDIVMIPDDEKHFTIHTDIEVSPQFFGWICGLGKTVRILAPAEVVEEMGEYVKGIAEMY